MVTTVCHNLDLLHRARSQEGATGVGSHKHRTNMTGESTV